jgi:hypothetical protein
MEWITATPQSSVRELGFSALISHAQHMQQIGALNNHAGTRR